MQMNAALISEKLSKIDLLSLGRSYWFYSFNGSKDYPFGFCPGFFCRDWTSRQVFSFQLGRVLETGQWYTVSVNKQ
jgi:hypothetical protein